MWLQYWNSGVSCAIRYQNSWETPQFRCCNCVSDCSVQCVIGTKHSVHSQVQWHSARLPGGSKMDERCYSNCTQHLPKCVAAVILDISICHRIVVHNDCCILGNDCLWFQKLLQDCIIPCIWTKRANQFIYIEVWLVGCSVTHPLWPMSLETDCSKFSLDCQGYSGFSS